MTIHALLEPLTGSAWHAFSLPTCKQDAPYHPTDPECPWAIRITDWEKEWNNLLPYGLQTDVNQAGCHAAGRLTGAQIGSWIDHLLAKGLTTVAQPLSRAMTAHLAPPPFWRWGVNDQWQLDFSRPLIMGIINVTPDSFSGDGLGKNHTAAVEQGLAMIAAGADILDIGGESTRPGSESVTLEEELNRIVPIVQQLAPRISTPICIDTSKPAVMKAALDNGAALINDVTALQGAEGQQTARMLAERKTPLILMHMQNQPATMQTAPEYRHVLSEVYDFLEKKITLCINAGMDPARLIADPGIGFGKSTEHNLTLLTKRRVFQGLGVPLLLGVSRKRIVGALTGESDPKQRDFGSHILATLANSQIIRVHDVAGARQALTVTTGFTHHTLKVAA